MSVYAPYLVRRISVGGAVSLAALLLSGLIFGLAPLLVRHQPPGPLPEPLRMVSVVRPAAPPPVPEEAPPPEPPPPEKIRKLKPQDVNRAKISPDLDLPALDLALDPRITGGPPLPVLPKGPGRGLGQADRGPMVLGRVPPPYPYMARRMGVEGWVKIRFLVSAQGRVDQLSVVKAEPPGYFEEAVLRTVPRWRFRPAVRRGHPREAWMETTVNFELK